MKHIRFCSPFLLLAVFLFSTITEGMAAKNDEHIRNQRSPIGMNIGSIVDWSTAIPFVDFFRSSRPFTDFDADLALDKNGWVTGVGAKGEAQTVLAWDMGDVFPSGLFTVLYDGKGSLSYGGGAKLVDRVDGKDTLMVSAKKGGIHLKISKVDAADPIRNIRVIMPGGVCESEPFKTVSSEQACRSHDYQAFKDHHETQIFNPDYLNFLADFKVLRFMDFLRTNDSELQGWSDRHLLTDSTWGGEAGGPVEILVELTNRIKADPWLTIPHQANDEYVRQLAIYVKEHVHDDATIYIEYSNEVWNGRFKQFQYMIDKGVEEKISGNQYQSGLRYYSRRSVEIFKIWESVFGGAQRLTRVISGQAGNPYVADVALEFEDTHKSVDAVAIAPYFGGSLGEPGKGAEKLSVNQLFRELRKTALPQSIDWMEKHGALAKKYDLDLLAYEGGQHLVGFNGEENNEKLTSLFDKANSNPQMRGLYARYLDAWKKAGGKTFVYYKDVSKKSKWGNWGIVESLTVPRQKAPKLDATLQFIEDNPRWW